jgi:hypothetical protein
VSQPAQGVCQQPPPPTVDDPQMVRHAHDWLRGQPWRANATGIDGWLLGDFDRPHS